MTLRVFPLSTRDRKNDERVETKTADRERRKERRRERKKEGRKDDEHGSWRQLFPFDIYIYIYIFTKVQKLDRLEKFVLGGEVLPRPLGAVILDIWKAAGSQYVVIAAAHRPIEVRHPPLIVHHIGVPHEIRRPRWLLRLNQVACQHLCTYGSCTHTRTRNQNMEYPRLVFSKLSYTVAICV